MLYKMRNAKTVRSTVGSVVYFLLGMRLLWLFLDLAPSARGTQPSYSKSALTAYVYVQTRINSTCLRGLCHRHIRRTP